MLEILDTYLKCALILQESLLEHFVIFIYFLQNNIIEGEFDLFVALGIGDSFSMVM